MNNGAEADDLAIQGDAESVNLGQGPSSEVCSAELALLHDMIDIAGSELSRLVSNIEPCQDNSITLVFVFQ